MEVCATQCGESETCVVSCSPESGDTVYHYLGDDMRRQPYAKKKSVPCKYICTRRRRMNTGNTLKTESCDFVTMTSLTGGDHARAVRSYLVCDGAQLLVLLVKHSGLNRTELYVRLCCRLEVEIL